MIKGTLTVTMVLAIMMATSGCTPRNQVNVSYQRNSTIVPAPKTVVQRGLYALFPGDGISPFDGGAVYLNPGDTFGFISHETNVAGFYTKDGQTKTIPLDGVLTTEYEWKYEGDKQP